MWICIFDNVALMYFVACYKFQDVIRALNRSSYIFLPPDVSYNVIAPFIREACKLAWNMCSLAHPLDVAIGVDAELYDDNK